VVDSQPTHRQRSIVDKRKGYTKTGKALVAITSTKALLNNHNTGSAGIDLRG
jgi:hypothetical protein